MTSTISVIIPTYNRSAKLKRALDSVLQETRVPIKVFVFDNCSSDDSQEMVTAYKAKDPRIVYHRHASNTGAIANYVFAFDSVASDYFLALSDDDWICPDFLFKAYHALQDDPSLGAAVFVAQEIDENGQLFHTYPTTPSLVPEGVLSIPDRVRSWFLNGHFQWTSTLWRKAVKDYIGYPYWHTGMPSDVDFQLQAFLQFPIRFFNQMGSYYFLHGGQFSNQYNQAGLADWVKLFERVDQKVLKDGIFTPDEYKLLREASVQRYRCAWVRPPTPALHGLGLLDTAYRAGVRLGDWQLALTLFESFLSEHGIDTQQAMRSADASMWGVQWGEKAATLAWLRIANQQIVGQIQQLGHYQSVVAQARLLLNQLDLGDQRN